MCFSAEVISREDGRSLQLLGVNTWSLRMKPTQEKTELRDGNPLDSVMPVARTILGLTLQ